MQPTKRPSVLMRCLSLAVVLAAIGISAPPASAAPASLTGVVACQNGKKVVGVWVQYYGGGGVRATLSRTSAPWLAKYTATITVPKSIKLHIGCGGSASSWGSDNRTAFTSVSAARNLSAICREAAGAPARRCRWWGSSLLVGMPFSGSINKYGFANVAPGSHRAYAGGGWGDWATDVYARAGTIVRARVYGPSARYTLKIDNIWSGCAGKRVMVGIYKRPSTKVGQVVYGHLAEVPAFTAGQKISTGTVLGKLKLWPRCPMWQVSTAGGVHTHLEVGTEPGKACYMPNMSTKSYPDTRMIGMITPRKTAKCS